jgi:hypothetical protein
VHTIEGLVFAAYSASMLKSFSVDSKMLPRCNQLVELKCHATRVIMASLLVAVGCGTGHAKITIRLAKYVDGVLVVQGQTDQRAQTVTLAGRYKTRTDRRGRFAFRVRYLPPDCLAEIRIGQEFYLASIANCEDR